MSNAEANWVSGRSSRPESLLWPLRLHFRSLLVAAVVSQLKLPELQKMDLLFYNAKSYLSFTKMDVRMNENQLPLEILGLLFLMEHLSLLS